MNRRDFIASILAAGVAPAFVRSESLMRLWVPKRKGILEILSGPPYMSDELIQLPNGVIAGCHPMPLVLSTKQIVFFNDAGMYYINENGIATIHGYPVIPILAT